MEGRNGFCWIYLFIRFSYSVSLDFVVGIFGEMFAALTKQVRKWWPFINIWITIQYKTKHERERERERNLETDGPFLWNKCKWRPCFSVHLSVAAQIIKLHSFAFISGRAIMHAVGCCTEEEEEEKDSKHFLIYAETIGSWLLWSVRWLKGKPTCVLLSVIFHHFFFHQTARLMLATAFSICFWLLFFLDIVLLFMMLPLPLTNIACFLLVGK